MTAHYTAEENEIIICSDFLGSVSFTERHTADNIHNKIKFVTTMEYKP